MNSFGCSCHSLAENNGASGEAGTAGTEGADFTRTDSDTLSLGVTMIVNPFIL